MTVKRPLIETHSGKGVNLVNPDPKTITIDDIAFGLSHQCRFNGHTRYHYSVAEHTLLCLFLARSQKATLDEQRSIFLHDAHEAYLGDIPTPIKRMLPNWDSLVDNFDDVLCKRFNIKSGLNFSLLHSIDHLALSIEVPQLMPFREENWYDGNLEQDWPDLGDFCESDGSYVFGQECLPATIRKIFLARAKELEVY